jgi:eukaryotic-like serine/threonine-protein kinase
VPGTLRYMPPERFNGDSDRRGDIYALGTTLYEMIALKPAYDEHDKARLIRQIVNDEPPPLRRIDPSVPRDLETIIHKAMAKDIAARFRTAAEMAEDLRLLLEDRPLRHARRSTATERAWRWCRRNPLVASLSAAAAVMMLAVLAVSTGAAILLKAKNTEVKSQLVITEAAKQEATKQVRRAKAADLEMREKLWEAKLASARASRYSGRSGRRFDALAYLAEAAELSRQLEHPPERVAKLRNEAIAALALPDIQITKTFGQWTDDIVSVDLNEDFDLYATSDQAGRCIIRSIEDDAEVSRLPQSAKPRKIMFGPGQWLADIDDKGTGGLRVWDLAGSMPALKLEDRRAVATLDFRPDGRLLAILLADGSVTTYELTSGKRRNDLPSRSILREPVIRLHPSLPYVVAASSVSNDAEIIQLETGATIDLKPLRPDGRQYLFRWNGDGEKLVIAGGGAGPTLYEFIGEPPFVRLLWTNSGQYAFSDGSHHVLNRAGDRVFSRGWTNVLVMTEPNTGRTLFETSAFHFPSSRRIKTDREQYRLFPGRVDDPVRRFGYWSVAEGQECRLIIPKSPRQGGRWTGVSPDGRLAIGVSGAQVIFYDLDLGREAGRLFLWGKGGDEIFAGFDLSGHLQTNTLSGCYRWPVRSDPIAPDTIVIGPPERLGLHPGPYTTASSRDGTVIAQAQMYGYSGGWLLHRDKPGAPHNLVPGAAIGNATVSPDGKWVAFEGSPGPLVVYDAESEKRSWTSPGESGGRSMFSPDGKWLATDRDNGRLYAVGTWKPGPKLGHGYLACFSADGTMAVLSTGEGPFRLVEVATGREIARFEDPDKFAEQVAMTPDGATLVATHKDGLRVWDLRLIRDELEKIGLNWIGPRFLPKEKRNRPLTVKVVGASLLDPNSMLSRAKKLLPLVRTDSEPELSLGAADELVRMGWHFLGLRAYDINIARHSALPHLRLHRGLELYRRGEWKAAAEDLRLVTTNDLRCRFLGEARPRLAWAYHELGRNADAATVLTEELESPSVARRTIEQAALRLLLAEFHALDGKAERAKRERDAAAALHSKLAEAANEFAWHWLTLRSDQTVGDNERQVPAALLLARKAIELAPAEPMYQNTFGVALYRSGRYAEAREILKASLVIGKGTQDAWDLFPLAVCHYRLGDRTAARESYDQAAAWVKEHANKLMGDARELADFQAEAGRLIGVVK